MKIGLVKTRHQKMFDILKLGANTFGHTVFNITAKNLAKIKECDCICMPGYNLNIGYFVLISLSEKVYNIVSRLKTILLGSLNF